MTTYNHHYFEIRYLFRVLKGLISSSAD